MENNELLRVRNLKTYFKSKEKVIKVVDGVDFEVNEGETLGIVGESGCGKSMTSLSIMQLVDEQGEISGGVFFQGENLLEKSEEEMRKIRGNKISMIFQEPMTSLNPVFTVGEQIAESLRIHQNMNKKDARNRAVEMLKLVGIPSPEKRAKQEPFELSGGMRQRVMIAMALACNPSLLIADEPTTALDVTIQAQILDLLKQLQDEFNSSIIMITHDLGVVSETCDNVVVMYAGKVVEHASVDDLFDHPLHPYTKGLLQAIPRVDEDIDELYNIEGTVPSPDNLPKGCSFAPRCPLAKDICYQTMPDLIELESGSKVRCFAYTAQWDEKGVENSDNNAKEAYSKG